MKLIVVEASFSPNDATGAFDAVHQQADAVREMEGCEGYSVYKSGSSIAIVQKWRSFETFDRYRASDIFGALIAALKPAMKAAPVTTIANVDT